MIRAFILSLFFVLSAVVSADPMELYWEDLIPEDFQPLEAAPDVDHQKSMAQLYPDAPVKQSLNGKEVRIPGFVVPLEGDDESLTEFLLVPYFGACIHVPPPPSNQIVFVKFEQGVPVDNLYDAIWVTGTLSTEAWKGDIASVGYTLAGVSVSPFE